MHLAETAFNAFVDQRVGCRERLQSLQVSFRIVVEDHTRIAGGAPLLGVNGVVIIGHGRSNAKAIKNAVRAAKFTVERRVLDVIRDGLGAMKAVP